MELLPSSSSLKGIVSTTNNPADLPPIPTTQVSEKKANKPADSHDSPEKSIFKSFRDRFFKKPPSEPTSPVHPPETTNTATHATTSSSNDNLKTSTDSSVPLSSQPAHSDISPTLLTSFTPERYYFGEALPLGVT